MEDVAALVDARSKISWYIGKAKRRVAGVHPGHLR